MNPIAEKWVAALRSGKYKQGRRQLRSGDSYCCLGVLCDLAVKEGVIKCERSLTFDAVLYGDELEKAYLPCQVITWSGMKNAFGRLNKVYLNEDLANMNDRGCSFEEIADAIERHYNELFKE